MDIAKLHSVFLKHATISTDTRNIRPNSIFFALKGANFNGNQYATEALKGGAAYAVVDNANYATEPRTILVEDCLETLQKLANFHRHFCNAKVIGLTGSNGKTTTKELIRAVLSKKYQTIATVGNLNNHIGVPLTLLTIKANTEIAIIEMGANHQKEIEFLCTISDPDYGYITNFGKAHLEGFGGIEGVIKGKCELYTYLKKHKKAIFINADDPIQNNALEKYVQKYGFSTADNTYYQCRLESTNPYISIRAEELTINTQLIGAYNFSNCCIAILFGSYFNVPKTTIKKALETYIPENNRSQIIRKNNVEIILDAYNANPDSMIAALKSFSSNDSLEKVIFLGDMFELGEYCEEEHQSIVDLLDKLDFKNVYLVGENFHKTRASRFSKYKSLESLVPELKKMPLSENTKLLIKGSRGMAMERILNYL